MKNPSGYGQKPLSTAYDGKYIYELSKQPVPTNKEFDKNTVEFYYQLGNISTFKRDTKALKDVVQRHLKATPLYQHVSIKTYYKPNKLESQFTTRRAGAMLSVCDQSNVVYSFNPFKLIF